MDKAEVMNLLQLVVTTMQNDYPTKQEARTAIENMLNEVDNAAEILSGKRIVKRHSTILETLCKGYSFARPKPLTNGTNSR